MNEQFLIQGIFHIAFSNNSYASENISSDLIKHIFPHGQFYISAFSFNENCTDTLSCRFTDLIVKYARRLSGFPVWYYQSENNESLLIFNCNEQFKPLNCINEIYAYFLKRHECPTYWGISRNCFCLSEFNFAKKEALISLSFSIWENNTNITVYSENVFAHYKNIYNFFYPATAKDLLIKALKTHDLDLISFIITVLEDENSKLMPFSYSQLIALNNAITDTFASLNPDKYHFSDKLLEFEQNVMKCLELPKNYFFLLKKLCFNISDELTQQKISRKSALVSDVSDYINSNFQNPNLNLSQTAQHFKISEGYLSSVFKELSGSCFAEYLEKCRINKSCILLSDTDMTIEQISKVIGYNSVYSFRRAFKRILKSSPSVYRKQP